MTFRNIPRPALALGILAALAAIASAFGLPFGADAAAGALMLATAPVGLPEIKSLIEAQGTAIEEFKRGIESRVDDLETKLARPGALARSGGSNIDPAEAKALDQAVRALLAGDQAKAYQHLREAKAMSVGSDVDGGYVVHPMISGTMTRVMAEVSPLFRLARRVPMPIGSGDAFEEPIDRDILAVTWVGEVQERPSTPTPKLGMLRVQLHEVYTQPAVSQKLLDTSYVNIVDWLSTKIGEGLGFAEGLAFHGGDGVAKPRGFLTFPTAATADATRPWGTIQHVNTGASGAFATPSTSVNPADVLVDAMSAMRPQYRQGCVWLMNSNVAGLCRKLKDADGRHVWADSLQEGQPARLLGYPVEIDEAMPDPSSGSLSIAFMNPKRCYVIPEQVGVRMLTDPFTNKPMVNLFAYRRVGGNVANFEAVKLVRFSN